MFQIPQRQYWPTTGENVPQKGRYDKESAEARTSNHAPNQQALQNTRQQNAFTIPSQAFISQSAQPQNIPQPRAMQMLGQIVTQPLQLVQTTAQNMSQQINQMMG